MTSDDLPHQVRALEERSLREAAEERAEELRQALAQRRAAEQEAEMRRRAALRNALQKQVLTAEIFRRNLRLPLTKLMIASDDTYECL